MEEEKIMAKRTSSKQSSPSMRGNTAAKSQAHDTQLHELFLDEIADIYNAEQQLLKGLEKMAAAAQSDELRDAFETHRDETEEQVSRLEQVVEALGESMKRKTCKGMQGLIQEGQEMIKEMKNSSACDASLIASAQKIEHYEIATYGTLCTWAEQMGHQEALELLKENLSEEKETDEKLTDVAETLANQRAQAE
jgi:ferritin-like metal-binding protein YciE